MFGKFYSFRFILFCVFLVTVCLFLIDCKNKNNTAIQLDLNKIIKSTPILAEQKKCERKWYGSLDKDKRCYKLQELLINSSSEGNIEGIQNALKQGADIESTYDSSLPALNAAIISGQKDAVILLLDNGAMVNTELKFGETALKDAVYYNNLDILEILIAHGADVCNKSLDWGTALNIALKKNKQEMISLLKNAGAEKCSNGDVK